MSQVHSIQFVGRSRFLDQPKRDRLRKLLNILAKDRRYEIDALIYVHQNDEELLVLNQSSLDHNTHTDIITFDLSDTEGRIDGEIYISVERIRENAKTFGVPFEEEYVRVASHGLLHLLGYNDKTKEEKTAMREAENQAIQLYQKYSST